MNQHEILTEKIREIITKAVAEVTGETATSHSVANIAIVQIAGLPGLASPASAEANNSDPMEGVHEVLRAVKRESEKRLYGNRAPSPSELREAVIEECAKLCDGLRRKDYSAENADWTAGTLDCATAIRALALPAAERGTP